MSRADRARERSSEHDLAAGPASLSAVTKGEYPYPPDEFDHVESGAGPRGAHRALRSRWTRAWPFVVVVVLFPALAYGAVTYWSSERGGGQELSAAVDPAETPAQTPAQPPADPPVQTPPAAPGPAAAPDLTTPVVVFNSTSRSGLAGSAAEVLTDAGWESATSANYTGGTLDSSTVIYGSAELEVTARAAADALGITTIQLAEVDTVTGLEIVLESDYTP